MKIKLFYRQHNRNVHNINSNLKKKFFKISKSKKIIMNFLKKEIKF